MVQRVIAWQVNYNKPLPYWKIHQYLLRYKYSILILNMNTFFSAKPQPAPLSEGLWILDPQYHIQLEDSFHSKGGIQETAHDHEIHLLYHVPRHPEVVNFTEC